MEKIGITDEDLTKVWAGNEIDWIFAKYATDAEKSKYNAILWNNDMKVASTSEDYKAEIAEKYYEKAKKEYQPTKAKADAAKNEKAAERNNETSDTKGNTPETISQKEYDSLTEEEKKNWVVVTETASDKSMAATMSSMGDAQKAISKLQPLQPVLKMTPNPLPGEQVSKALDDLEALLKTLDPIEEAAKTPPLEILVKPLVAFINQLFSVIGMMLTMQFMMAKGQKLFTDDLCDAVDQVDWEGLKEDIKNFKEKYKEAKEKAGKAVDSVSSASTETAAAGAAGAAEGAATETTNKVKDAVTTEASDADVERKTYDLAEKQKNALSDSAKNTMEEVEKAADAVYDSLMLADSAARATKIYKENVAIWFSWEEMGKKVIDVAKKLGVDASPLNAPSKESQEAIEKMFPDPMKAVNKVNKQIAKLNKPSEKKYARVEEQNVNVEIFQSDTIDPPPKVRMDDKASQHYCIGDLCKSDTATKAKIDNSPTQEVAENLKLLSENVIEKVRQQFGDVIITSGYRSPELNEELRKQKKNPSKNSQHLTGQAVDMVFTKVKPYEAACWIRDNLKDEKGRPKYDQLILEYDKQGNVWVHCSYNKNGCHGDVLTYPGKKPYEPGLLVLKV